MDDDEFGRLIFLFDPSLSFQNDLREKLCDLTNSTGSEELFAKRSEASFLAWWMRELDLVSHVSLMEVLLAVRRYLVPVIMS